MLHLKLVHHFLHVRQINVFIDEANQIYTAMPMYNLIEYSDNIQTHQEVYGNLKEMKFQIIMLI